MDEEEYDDEEKKPAVIRLPFKTTPERQVYLSLDTG